ncbi:MAG: cell wall-binding repeat-containing protein [Desulfitobacteriaceae bacterium]|nr:cell wall-binding repeat-containing protein [Desulfitobacteriaceae bacterium]MDI6915728.1 cell wall-binding repeat-containing protein [Desulfitobacteriaceae bacterium]
MLIKHHIKKLVSAIAIITLIAVSLPTNVQQAIATTQLTPKRLAGASRTLTAVEISKEGWPNGASAVVLTRGDDFPDALSGSTLAAAFDSPILLTDNKVLSSETETEIARLHPTTVYILGGTGAVSTGIETALAAKYKVTRLAGSSRYDTAASIASYLKDAGKLTSTKAVIAYAQNFPDALAISSWAAHKGVPILLSETNSIPDATSHALSNLGITDTIIAGGSGVISPTVESLLPHAVRYGGANRYETAVNISEGLSIDTHSIFVATGGNFPDALAGSALAAKTGSAIVLVDKTLDASVSSFLSNHLGYVKNIFVLGGAGVVLPNTVSAVAQRLGGTSGLLKVSYINVGQGDSILIQTPSGMSALIDGGKTDQTSTVETYLRNSGVTKLDYVIATHEDSDHIGSLDSVITDFHPTKVYLPDMPANNTYTFADFLNAVQAAGLKLTTAKAGVSLDMGSDIQATFVGPVKDSYSEDNDYSTVLRIKYGSTSFLFTGDAESASENDMMTSGADLKSTVLKVGHHGSKYSTSDAFLDAVKPQYAVISVGENNYGHPSADVIQRLAQHGVSVFRTDESGTVVAESNGTNVTFNTNPSAPVTTPNPTPASSDVEIASIDLSVEVVTITNKGANVVDLTGWKLVSEVGSQTFDFPSGTNIPAGGILKVVSGSNATAGSNTLVWTKLNIWNNSGDPGALYNAQGQLVSRY